MQYPNGTFVNLAMIRGSARYNSLIERLMKIDSSRAEECDRLYGWNGVFWDLKRSLYPLGIATSADVRTLGNMLYSLRKESERILGTSITRASVSAARRHIHMKQYCMDQDLNDALRYAGLEPWADVVPAPHFLDESAYLFEGLAVLAGNGRFLCEPWGCNRHSWWLVGDRQDVFYIR